MALYIVIRAGHGLQVNDCLFGSDHFRKEGSSQVRFRAFDETGRTDRGEVHLPVDWVRQNMELSFREPGRESPEEIAFLQRVGFIAPPAQVEPAEEIGIIAPLDIPSLTNSGLRRSPRVDDLTALENEKGLTLTSLIARSGRVARLDVRERHLAFEALQGLAATSGTPPIRIESRARALLADKIIEYLRRFKSKTELRAPGSAKLVTGMNERATAFVRLNGSSGNLAVLGWDHAMVVKRLLGQYCVTQIWAHAKGGSPIHPVYGRLIAGEDPERLDSEQCAIAERVLLSPHTCTVCKGSSCSWLRIPLPKPIRIERLVTFQASSCSVCVLHSSRLDEIIISHMDASPTIPVGQIHLRELGPGVKLRAIASVFPELAEMRKVLHSCSLVEATPIFLRRGPMPVDDQPAMLGWSNLESGLVFPPASECVTFTGVIGAVQVYKSAVSKELMSYGPRGLLPTKFQELRSIAPQDLELEAILAMSQEELMGVASKLRGQQFGPTHLRLVNEVGMALFELAGSDSVLLKLKQKSETNYFAAGLRALLIFGHIPEHVSDPLIAAVVELVDRLTPALQLAFSVPLTDDAFSALEHAIETSAK